MSTPIIITAIISICVVSIVLSEQIKDYKLRKQQMNADAIVRAEEIKAKNQLEIEQLYLSNNNQQTKSTLNNYDDDFRNSRLNKERL
ncbi:MAG: hypothetical protein K0R50_3160 [Eubacterium sp.]|nr:hypothetical protein [Eubacterium sp.]